MIPDAQYGRRAIAWLARFWRDRLTLLIVVLAGLGTAHILVRIATEPSSNNIYQNSLLHAALNLLAGEGYRDFRGEPMTMWPPLFSLLLAAFGWVGIEPLEAGRWVSAIAFGLTILAAGCWLRSNLRSRLLALATTATLVTALPLSYSLPMIWTGYFIGETESLFVLFTLLALMQLAAFLNRRTDAPLWWAAGFSALATLTRYPGVVLIGTGVLLLLPLARRKAALVFGAISSVPLLAVLAHNWAVTGHLTRAAGYREKHASGQSLSDGLSQAIEVFRAWVVPPNAPDGLAYLLGLTVAAVGLAGAAVGLRSRRPDSETAPVYVRLGLVIPFGAFSVLYLVFLIVVVPFTVDQPIHNRFLLPIYVPLLLTAVFLLDRFLSIEAAGWMAAGRYGLAALVGLGALAHLCFSARENLRTTQAYVAQYGKTPRKLIRWQPHWQHSATLKYIRDSHIVGRVYSNKVTFALLGDWTAATLRTYRNIPRKRKMEWAEIEAGAHIVWLDEFLYDNREYLGYDYLDVRLLPGLEIVAELADGVVFRRTAYEPFDAARHRARKQRYVEQLIQQASEQVGRAGWTVYRTGRTLIYRKEPCATADLQAKFVLHVVPVDPADLPAHRQQYDSENLDFYFDWNSLYKSLGFRLDDQCIAIAQLPDYDIDRIHIGQWIAAEDRTLWEAEFSPGR